MYVIVNEYLKPYPNYIKNKEIISTIKITDDCIFYFINSKNENFEKKIENKNFGVSNDTKDEIYYSSRIEGINLQKNY